MGYIILFLTVSQVAQKLGYPEDPWYRLYGFAYIPKSQLREPDGRGFKVIEGAAKSRPTKPVPQTFIVHGHDLEAVTQLKQIIMEQLQWPSPHILGELPSHSNTIIEKFEEYARTADIAFVLLTPDDKRIEKKCPSSSLFVPRQNVVLEMGYFFAALKRNNGRVLLLRHKDAELPSDIHGVVYIDISNGVDAAATMIKKELSDFL